MDTKFSAMPNNFISKISKITNKTKSSQLCWELFCLWSFTNKKLKQILVENDMPSLSVHGLRHSNASLLINNGYDVKAISEHLGHCNTEITSNIYVHIFKEYKAKMAESIEHDLL